MINRVKINNFGPLIDLQWENIGKINLVIGNNGCGKTFLLKILYSTMKTLEQYKRGNDHRTIAEVLFEKIYWTFQAEKIGDLVSKGSKAPLSCSIHCNEQFFKYRFGKETSKQISMLENNVPPRRSNSIFLPAKEVLSLQNIILKSREQDQSFGFDDTCFDLARAIRQLPQKGKNHAVFAQPRNSLKEMLGGKIEFDETSGRWQFKKGKQKFSIHVTAEGIKKIAVLDTLLGNRYLNTDSIVLIDEPESALHPVAISSLIDIISILSERGIQFFLASHSYFVVKKLFLIAQEKNMSIPVISLLDDNCVCEDLSNGMPQNAIVDESIRLYQEEVAMVLK